MSVTNPERVVTKQDLADFYGQILPYLGACPSAIANKFGKGDLYSTEEKMIGQWINGKPLYQKAIEFSFSQSETTKTIDSTLTRSYIEYIVGFNGGYIQSDGNKMAIPRVPLSQFNGITAYADASGLIIARTSNTPIGSGFINVQYTKTTDTAISIGEATEYSTEEKVIGTWIDGKPIYQRTFQDTLPNVTSQATPVDKYIELNISIDTFVKVEGFMRFTNGVDRPLNTCYKASAGIVYNYVGGVPNSATTHANTIQLSNSHQNWNGMPCYITIQYTKTTT